MIESYRSSRPVAVWEVDDWLAEADIEEIVRRPPMEIIEEAWDEGIKVDGRPIVLFGGEDAIREWQDRQREKQSQ